MLSAHSRPLVSDSSRARVFDQLGFYFSFRILLLLFLRIGFRIRRQNSSSSDLSLSIFSIIIHGWRGWRARAREFVGLRAVRVCANDSGVSHKQARDSSLSL